MKKDLIYRYLNDDELLRISRKIEESEALTSGEIRVSIKEKEGFLIKRKPLSEKARTEFFRLNMNNTKDRTGILIYLLLGEKQFYILADTGINEKVEQQVWDAIRDEMQLMFRNGRFCDGIILGVDEIAKVLSRYFPRKADDKDELSNKVVF